MVRRAKRILEQSERDDPPMWLIDVFNPIIDRLIIGALMKPDLEREAWERDIFKPPFLARMLERCGKYTDGLDDRDAFLTSALDQFYATREKIVTSFGVLECWGDALKFAAESRSKWLVHYGSCLESRKWVRGIHLGRS